MRARDVGVSSGVPPVSEAGIGIKKAGVDDDIAANWHSKYDYSNTFLAFTSLALISIAWRFMSASYAAVLFSRITCALFCISSSTANFSPVTQSYYMKMLPDIFPYKKQIVILNGIGYLVFGAGLLFPSGWGVRTISAWGLLGLLAFNTIGLVKLCLSRETQRATGTTPRAAYIRLALQGVFAMWVFLSAHQPLSTLARFVSNVFGFKMLKNIL